MGLEFEINRPDARVFRRAFIKRRQTSNGKYETNWFEITKYVKKWGSYSRNVDAIRLNRFVHSGANLKVRNDTGAFNPEDNQTSLWSGYMTRYRTLLKIEAGYWDDDQTELPTDTTLGVFIMNDEIPISGVTNEATIKAKSLSSVLSEVRASDVAGITTTLTANQIIGSIRDHTDGSGNFYLREFITSTSWTIQTTTNSYFFGTTTAFGSMSCWDLMEKLAETEGYLLLINRSGGIEFRNRDERTTTSQFSFRGLGFNEMSVIRLNEYKEPLNKLYTYFRLKYLTADTSTSYVTAGSTSSVDPSSTAWKYGSRQYDFSFEFANNTTAAQNIVNNLFNTFSVLKDEVNILTKLAPQLEISDKVTLSYRSYDLANTVLWNLFKWDEVLFPTESGENFDFNNVNFKLLSVNHDLDNFTSSFQMREI